MASAISGLVMAPGFTPALWQVLVGWSNTRPVRIMRPIQASFNCLDIGRFLDSSKGFTAKSLILLAPPRGIEPLFSG
jgi:hypothetical protein